MNTGFFARPFAHRGLHDAGRGRVENSLSAMRAAVEAGYAVEMDVQLTADGQAVVFHDADLDRLTDSQGPVRQQSAEALTRVALLGSSDTLQSLPTVLAMIAGRVPVTIEIKDQDGAMGPGIGPLERAVAKALLAYDGLAAAMSFNPFSVMEMQRLAPEIPRGLVASAAGSLSYEGLDRAHRERLGTLSDFEAAGASFVSWGIAAFPDGRVAALRACGVPVLCWTVQSPEDAAFALRYADQITFEGYIP